MKADPCFGSAFLFINNRIILELICYFCSKLTTMSKTASIRIDSELLEKVKELAINEGRTIKNQIERLIKIGLTFAGKSERAMK